MGLGREHARAGREGRKEGEDKKKNIRPLRSQVLVLERRRTGIITELNFIFAVLSVYSRLRV